MDSRTSQTLKRVVVYAYQDGIDLAIQETNLPDQTFPPENPYNIDQILDPAFLID